MVQSRTRRRPRDKEISAVHLKWKPYEPTAKEKRQAEQIKKKQEERAPTGDVGGPAKGAGGGAQRWAPGPLVLTGLPATDVSAELSR